MTVQEPNAGVQHPEPAGGADAAPGWYSDEIATFGDRVTGARELAGLSQAKLAARLGVDSRTLRAWEEDLSEPRAARLQMLAGLLGVSVRWLLTGEGEGPDGPEAVHETGGPSAGLAQVAPLLAEMRQLQGEMSAMAGRLGRLEKRLRRLALAQRGDPLASEDAE